NRGAARGGDPPRTPAAGVLVRLWVADGEDPAARRDARAGDRGLGAPPDTRRGHRHRGRARRCRIRPLRRRGGRPQARPPLPPPGAFGLNFEIRAAAPEEFPDVVTPIFHYFGSKPDPDFV